MSNKISKSPEVLAKEAKIAELEVILRKKKTSLKSIKTRLINTKQKIEDHQRTVETTVMRNLEDVDDLRIEIVQLIKQILKFKNLHKEDRDGLNGILEEFQQGFGEDFEEMKKFKEQLKNGEIDFEEEFQNKIHDIFEPFKVKPTEKEQKNIRKVYLGLSKKFHPDKAKDETQAKEYHSVMQQIISAYENNDIDTLLEMERIHLNKMPEIGDAITSDILQQKIDYLEREITFITNQFERESAELKNLRKSELGKMLAAEAKAEKQGEGLSQMGNEMETQIMMFKDLKEALKESVEIGNLSPKVFEVLMQDAQSNMPKGEINIEDILSLMSDGEVDMQEMANLFTITNERPIINPKFPVGSTVAVNKNINLGHTSIKIKNWKGTIFKAYYEGEEEVYEVAFDSDSLSTLTKEQITRFVEEDFCFGLQGFEKAELKVTTINETIKESIANYRQLVHHNLWNMYDIPKAKVNQLKKILLASPELSDIDNWQNYFKQNLKLPADVYSKGLLETPMGLEAKILKILSNLPNQEFEPTEEIMVIIQTDGPFGEEHTYPLYDLMHQNNKKVNKALELYNIWLKVLIY